jgi:AP-1 complex subunit gamma-1
MSTRLRDMIKTIRQCKTAAEEREEIAKECALIRSAIRDDDADNRPRNLAKLLYIHMLGYPTHFGQMECLKLIVSQNYADKRLGYLALMLLLDERQEVLMLVTNSLKNDLNHPNQYVVGLALCSLANISSAAIARDLSTDVVKLLSNPNPYIRKKAALCAVRVIRKVPDLLENFVPKIRLLLQEKNHGVLITTVSLMLEICETDKSRIEIFRKLAPACVRILRTLVQAGYAPEHDVSGITDPFLQVRVLRLLAILGKDDPTAAESMNDVLAQVATNTESIRNVGNSILYECVQTIMAIGAESGLRILAVNILGRFLMNKDNNIRYVALNVLTKVVGADLQAVQRHRNTIVECLKDHDTSIRKRALELVYILANESNILSLVRELLGILQTSDSEFRGDLSAKICSVTEKYAPSKKWHVNTILKVFSVSGCTIPDQTISNMISLITQNPELQLHAVRHLFLALKNDLLNQSLVQLALWCVGEFGDLLISSDVAVLGDDLPVSPDQPLSEEEKGTLGPVSELELVNMLEEISRHAATNVLSKQFLLTALLKLSDRLQTSPQHLTRIKTLIEQHKDSLHLELQQRSCEYSNVLRVQPSVQNVILDRIPPLAEVRTSTPSSQTPSSANNLVSMVPSTPPATEGKGFMNELFGEVLETQPVVPRSAFPTTNGPEKKDGGSVLDLLSNLNVPSSVSTSQPLFGGPLSSFPQTSPQPQIVDLLSLSQPSPPPALNNFPTPSSYPPPFAAPSPIPNLSGPHNDINVLGQFAPSPSLTPVVSPLMSAPVAQGPYTFVAHDANGLNVTISATKNKNDLKVTLLNVVCSSSISIPMSEFAMKFAVPKYMKIAQIGQPSRTDITFGASLQQQIIVMNSMQGQAPIMVKIKIDYKLNGSPVSLFVDAQNFPASL